MKSSAPRTEEQRSGRAATRHLSWLIIALTLLVFGATVWFVTVRLEQETRAQTIARDAEILHAVMLMQQMNERELDPGFSVSGDAGEAAQWQLALQASRLKGVIGIRLFKGDGHFVTALPLYVTEAELGSSDLQTLKTLQPVTRFEPEARLEPDYLIPGSRGASDPVPLLVVDVPIHAPDGKELHGVAQFINDGTTLAGRLDTLRRAIWFQAWLVFAVGGAVILLGLGWALKRLQQRTERLVQANQELAVAAKTAAVGAISTQLIHGLKSPLFGLQAIIGGLGTEGTDDPVKQTALRATQRMQDMINQVMRVLRDQRAMRAPETSLAEMLDELRDRVEAVAEASEVHLETSPPPHGYMPAQAANLVLIILTNLVQNGMEATPSGKSVTITTTRLKNGGVEFTVRDQGTGIAPEVKSGLFMPLNSTKEGGGGIGLSICKQLASHLNARLELRVSSPNGSEFALTVPADHVAGPARRPIQPDVSLVV